MILPNDLIELQLAQIDLLMAMYPNEGAISIDEASTTTLNILRESFDSDEATTGRDFLKQSPNAVSLLLALEVDSLPFDDNTNTKAFQLDITVPFTYQYDDDGTGAISPGNEPPRPRIRLLQPSWMNKAEVAALMAHIPQDEDNSDLFLTIENIKEAVASHLSSLQLKSDADCPTDAGNGGSNNQQETNAFITRVWFYFPSISTRSKRDDIVNYAPTYRLTGFLLSGKPGVLCLEGASDRVDAYMKFIKTESWGDIPSHQKKVSERFREVGVSRVFADMQEITDDLGDRRGERANRGDMKALEAWLVQRGLGEALMKVLT